MKMLFSKTDYRPLAKGDNYTNKFIVISPDFFKAEYKEAKNQLFYATGGFGCYPEKMGGKVFGKWFDEYGVTRREYILGVATEEAISEWEKVYGMSRDILTSNER